MLYTYTLSRFDLRFHIPDGSSAPGHYSQGGPEKQDSLAEPYSSEADLERQAAAEQPERERRWEEQLSGELPQKEYEMTEAR